MALWQEWLKTRHLLFGQPVKIAHHALPQLESVHHAASGGASRLMGPEPKLSR